MKRLFSYLDIAYSLVNTRDGENLTVIATFGNPDSWRVQPGPTGGWICR